MYADRDTTARYYHFLAEVLANHIRTIQGFRPESKAFLHPLSTGYAAADAAGTYITEVNGWGLGDEPVSEAEIDLVMEYYHAAGFTPQIELSPHADPTLMSRLEDRGFRVRDWIAASGRALNEQDRTPGLPDGIRFRQAQPEDDETWTHTLALGFENRDAGEVEENTLDIGRGAFHHPWSIPFIAEIDGEPAGCSAVVVHDDLAYMATASTLPRFRRRGIQSGMVRIRLAEAVKRGAREILHQSSLNSSSNRNALAAGMQIRMVSAYMKRS